MKICGFWFVPIYFIFFLVPQNYKNKNAVLLIPIKEFFRDKKKIPFSCLIYYQLASLPFAGTLRMEKSFIVPFFYSCFFGSKHLNHRLPMPYKISKFYLVFQFNFFQAFQVYFGYFGFMFCVQHCMFSLNYRLCTGNG